MTCRSLGSSGFFGACLVLMLTCASHAQPTPTALPVASAPPASSDGKPAATSVPAPEAGALPEPPPAPLADAADDPSEPAPAPLTVEPGPDADPVLRFRYHADQASRLFADSKWLPAIEEFQAAYRINQRPLLLFNIAQAYRKAGKWAAALEHYVRYSREDPKSQLAPEADAYAAAMRAKIDVERSEAERSQANQQVAARAQEAQRLAQQNQLLEKRELEAVRSLQALKKQPVYKKAWFWSTVAAAGAVVIIGVGLGVGLAPRPPATEGGIYDVDF